jgi:hypothetical protein
VIAQVAVATFADPLRSAVDVVQAVIPAEPVTVKTTVPLGVAPFVGPVTVAVKRTLPPKAVTPLLETILVGVAFTTVSVFVADVTVL